MKIHPLRFPLAMMILPAIATLAPARTTQAGFIASNLGSGGSYNANSGYTLSGPQSSSGLGYSLAVEFQVTGGAPVAFGAAQLALQYHSGANALDVLLMSNSGGLPGSTLETIHVVNIPTGPSLVTAVSSTDTLLTPGANYWLVAVASNDTYLTWMMNGQGQANHLAYEINHGSGPLGWQTSSGSTDVAFSVAAVPAPSAAALLGLGLVTAGGFSAGRRFLDRGDE
jgi:hypothetical protein